MSPQEEHDLQMQDALEPQEGSKARLEALLKAKSGSSEAMSQSAPSDAVAAQMQRHRGLTAEKAVEMAEAFGF
jgi:hypothetical protein